MLDTKISESECKELINAECAIVERHYEKVIAALRAERDEFWEELKQLKHSRRLDNAFD